jgi:hypothetical protein
VPQTNDSGAGAKQVPDYRFDLVTHHPPRGRTDAALARPRPEHSIEQYLAVAAAQPPARLGIQVDAWVVNYFMVAQEGGPVVAAILIYPGDLDEDDQPATLPTGGIGARFLRQLRPANAQRFARTELAERAEPGDPLADSVALHGYVPAELERNRPRGRPMRPHRDFALVASEYVRALDQGSPHPVKDVAERLNYSRGTIRDMLVKARDRKLLTKTKRGRAGGAMTPKGLRELTGMGSASRSG